MEMAPPTPKGWGEEVQKSLPRFTKPFWACVKRGTLSIVSFPQTWGDGGAAFPAGGVPLRGGGASLFIFYTCVVVVSVSLTSPTALFPSK